MRLRKHGGIPSEIVGGESGLAQEIGAAGPYFAGSPARPVERLSSPRAPTK
jgi:hypothetical protein